MGRGQRLRKMFLGWSNEMKTNERATYHGAPSIRELDLRPPRHFDKSVVSPKVLLLCGQVDIWPRKGDENIDLHIYR